MLPCPRCEKPTPHRTPRVEREENGEKFQAMECAVCGCWTKIYTGQNGQQFQEGVETPDKTDFSVLDDEPDKPSGGE
jgi:hypothetical protein